MLQYCALLLCSVSALLAIRLILRGAATYAKAVIVRMLNTGAWQNRVIGCQANNMDCDTSCLRVCGASPAGCLGLLLGMCAAHAVFMDLLSECSCLLLQLQLGLGGCELELCLQATFVRAFVRTWQLLICLADGCADLQDGTTPVSYAVILSF